MAYGKVVFMVGDEVVGSKRAFALWTPVHTEVGRINQPSLCFSRHWQGSLAKENFGNENRKHRKVVKKEREA